jgi:Eukaryotic-type carbonic anhydrase.
MTRKFVSFVRTGRNDTDPFPFVPGTQQVRTSAPVFLLQVSGTLHNTGQTLVFRVDKDTKHHVNISGGPLAYRYQFEEIYIHYGTENHQGSEHHIHGYSFPAEVSQNFFPKSH